ncbi:MAG: iron complex transport system ATP-binding protein [Psychromonas sp.]|jgi:iron complex transport system ATP-binding protein|uniref:ABC transporter ATP-binding protein n=1 Tax=Psychromonas sp. TaxID=1884585 RepID=UPI0039E462DF
MSLKINHLSVSFGKNIILNNMSIPEIYPGEMVSLIGKNGASKSTILKQMTKRIRFNPDSMTLGGKPLRIDDIGYLPQDHRISANITVLELLITTMHVWANSLFTKARSAENALTLLESIGILHLANKVCTELSGGESQMVGLAQSVINQPKVLILDEPTSALDMHNQFKLLEYIKHYARSTNACVLMVVHDLNLAIQYSDKVAALHNGSLFAYGEPKRIIDKQLIRDIFNVNSQIIQLDNYPVVVACL